MNLKHFKRKKNQTFNSYYLEMMFDTLKLIYTQDEALELVGRYEKVYNEKIKELEEENRLLKDKLNAFESSKFNTMALLEIQHPKTAREAENLSQYKKVFERLYNDRLYCLEQEKKKLKSDLAYERTMLDNVKAEYECSQDVIKELEEKIRFLEQCLDNKEKVNKSMREELK